MKIQVPAHIQSLQPYKPGRPIADVMKEYGLKHVTKLASNENPLGPSPKAVEAMKQELSTLEFYPNGGRSLREELATMFGLSVEEVIAGSGSEGVMNNLMRTFLEKGDEVLTSEGTFGGFYVLANAMGLKMNLAPMKDYAYDLDAILARLTPNTKLIYLANPNNPTGTYFNKEAFFRFYQQVPESVLIVHDEAYYDFAIDDVDGYYTLIGENLPNVIVLRTFSKSHGLAAVRIGYGVAPKEIIAPMLKVKLPFEPSGPAQAAGIGALHDKEFLHRTIEVNREGKVYFRNGFRDLGLKFVETAANFFCILFENADAAVHFAHQMEKRGVIVRPLSGFSLAEAVRISIGTPEQNKEAVRVMTEVLEEMHVASE